LKIYTIGHSNHPLERFLALLEQHSIELIADVRSQPYSRWVPHFNRQRLARALEAAGVGYVHLSELGGRPRDAAFLGPDGQPDYARIRASERFQAGLDRLLALATERRTAIMCAEGDYRRCHRHWLIEPALAQRGVRVLHIQPDGSLTEAHEEPEQLRLW